MKDDRLTKKVYMTETKGNDGRGRPRCNFIDHIKKILNELRLKLHTTAEHERYNKYKRSEMFRRLLGSSKPISRSILFNCIRDKVTTINLTKKQSHQESDQVLKWIMLVIPVGSFGLGCWQTHRLRWKLSLISQMQEKTNSSIKEFPNDISALETMEYEPVKVRGRFLHDKEIFIGPRSLINKATSSQTGSLYSNPKTNQGWLVITPFQISETGQTILVNRGWITQHMKPKEKRQASMITHEVDIVGLVRLTEKRPQFVPKNQPERSAWYYRDLDEMGEYLGCLPVWLDVRGHSDPPEGWPIPNQTRVTLRNEHLSYLVTWYLLSVLTAFMWHRVFIKKLPLA